MVCKMGRFVNKLSISRGRCNGIRSFPIFSVVSKEYHFEHFASKSPAFIEIAELGLFGIILIIREENLKRTGIAHNFG